MTETSASAAALVPTALPSRIEGFAWLVVAPVLLALAVTATWSGNAVHVVHVMVLLTIGSTLFRGEGGHLFRLAFALNVVVVFMLAAQFTSTNGVPFTGGGDDIFFYDTSRRLGASFARGDWRAIKEYTQYSGFGYIVLGGLLHAVSAPVGEAGPLTIRLWGAFAGATIGPASLLLARALSPALPHSRATKVAVAAGLYPILIHYSAIGLRDIWLAAGATWMIALLASARTARRGPMASWIGPALLLLATALLRPESAAPLLLFWLALLYSRRHSTGAKLVSATILIVSVALVAGFRDVIVAQLIREQLSYAYAADAAGPGSLGARILAMSGTLGYIARYAYAIITPVPPLTVVRPDTILIGFGATIWYFLVPLAADGFVIARRAQPELKAVADALLVFMATLLLGVALTSIDLRHKLPLIPGTVAMASVSLATRSARWRYDRFTALTLAGVGLGALYLMLKFR